MNEANCTSPGLCLCVCAVMQTNVPLYSTSQEQRKVELHTVEVGQNQLHRLVRMEMATYLTM